ncbi:hypothetical protein [Flavobacterium davisii]|uniref:hypothetical protein n=1 Tax=Flavobacterium davisii TaxID=2906077 RepID=UPI0035D09365
MKRKISISLFTLLLFFQNTYCQEKSNRIYSFNLTEIYFYKYKPEFIIKATKDFKNIKNEFPEELIQSILSCSNEEWEIFNTLGGRQKADINDQSHYDRVKKMNVDKNYFELKHKLEFEIDGIPTAIVKFYFITQESPKPQAGITVMQKYAGRWYKTSMKMVSNLAMTALRLKTDELEKIILEKNESPQLQELNKRVFIKGKLDFNKLNQEIDSWYIDKSINNLNKKDYFKDPYSIL